MRWLLGVLKDSNVKKLHVGGVESGCVGEVML
jgi:hypothetical protein